MILQGRVAIVTGAGSGIGRAGAEIMAREGATVVVADRNPSAGAETVGRIEATGGRALAVETDVGVDADLDRLVARTVDTFSRVDILHSHAGIQVEGPLETVDPAGMDNSWRINVRAHFHLARLVLPHMRERGAGSIIVTSSNSGVFYDHEMIAYATSKHAAVAMVKQIAIDYGKHNVRVNALCPGWVDTPFNDAFTRQMGGRDKLLAYIRDKIPMGRFASVEEIAEAILFLASDRSAFMTGHALVIDGGESIA
jgi:NAD(P)-dependent dehydrogenase (short-subunit alcohol dehydrogenase family)